MRLLKSSGNVCAITVASILLCSCSDQNDVKDADLALSLASIDVSEGKPIDRSKLAAMPGIDAALEQRAEGVKVSVSKQLRDPTDLIWGDIWTPDLITICGTVNGRNAYGAYAGAIDFYALDGQLARLPGHPQYQAKDLLRCLEGDDHRVILKAAQP